MDFDFSEDQEMLRDSVRRWVDKEHGFEARRASAKAGGFARKAWNGIAGLGVMGIAVPEASGGMGFGPVEAMVVMEELGRGLVLEPVAQTALVAPVVLGAAGEAAGDWLGRIAGGDAIAVLAQEERRSRYRLAHVETRATRAGDGWTLDGTKIAVPAAPHADAFLVSARVSGEAGDPAGVGLFLVEKGATGATVESYPTQDGASSGSLVLAGARATELVAPGAAIRVLEHAADVAIAALAAEAVGAMDALVRLTVEYMNTRKQFGVPIATFQALRHRIADVKMQLELARSMSYFATLKLGEASAARRRALSQAKVQMGRSMRFVGQECIQLHGGIGVTEEYAASHYFKRLTVIELSFGDTLHHLGEVSARMQDTAGVFA
jgi:alkylation response protein AidB-like acyl-CoA dehydrogenase